VAHIHVHLSTCVSRALNDRVGVRCREEDYARPLTEDELAERDALISENPFKDWMRRDFNAFIRACEKHGRGNIDAIAKEVDSKSEVEARAVLMLAMRAMSMSYVDFITCCSVQSHRVILCSSAALAGAPLRST
jgi:hypothetical protein